MEETSTNIDSEKTSTSIDSEKTANNNDNVENTFDFLDFDNCFTADESKDMELQLEVKNLMDSLNLPVDINSEPSSTKQNGCLAHELYDQLLKERKLANELREKSRNLDLQLAKYERRTSTVMGDLFRVRAELDTLQEDYTAAQNENSEKTMKVEKLDVELRQFKELRKKRKKEMEEKDKICQKISIAAAENESLHTSLGKLNASLSETNAAIRKKKAYHRHLLKTLTDFTKALSARGTLTPKVKEKFSTLSKELESEDCCPLELKAEISKLLKLKVRSPSNKTHCNGNGEMHLSSTTCFKTPTKSSLPPASPRGEKFDYEDHFFDVTLPINSDDELNDISITDIEHLRKQVFKNVNSLKAVSPIPQEPLHANFSDLPISGGKSVEENNSESEFRNRDLTSYQNRFEPRHLVLPSNYSINESPKRPQLLHQLSEGFSVEQNEPFNHSMPEALTDQCHSLESPSCPSVQNKSPYKIVAKRLHNGLIELHFNISNPFNLEVDPETLNATLTIGSFDEESYEPAAKKIKIDNDFNGQHHIEESEMLTENYNEKLPTVKQSSISVPFNSLNEINDEHMEDDSYTQCTRTEAMVELHENKLCNNQLQFVNSEKTNYFIAGQNSNIKLTNVSKDLSPFKPIMSPKDSEDYNVNNFCKSNNMDNSNAKDIDKLQESNDFCPIKGVFNEIQPLISSVDINIDKSLPPMNATTKQNDVQLLENAVTFADTVESNINTTKVISSDQKSNICNGESAHAVSYPEKDELLEASVRPELKCIKSMSQEDEQVTATVDSSDIVNGQKLGKNQSSKECSNNCANSISEQFNDGNHNISNEGCGREEIVERENSTPQYNSDCINSVVGGKNSKIPENVELIEDNITSTNNAHIPSIFQIKTPCESVLTDIEMLSERKVEFLNYASELKNKPENFVMEEELNEPLFCEPNDSSYTLEKTNVNFLQANGSTDFAFCNHKSIVEKQCSEIENHDETTNGDCNDRFEDFLSKLQNKTLVELVLNDVDKLSEKNIEFQSNSTESKHKPENFVSEKESNKLLSGETNDSSHTLVKTNDNSLQASGSTDFDFCNNKSFIEEQYSEIENQEETINDDYSDRFEDFSSSSQSKTPVELVLNNVDKLSEKNIEFQNNLFESKNKPKYFIMEEKSNEPLLCESNDSSETLVKANDDCFQANGSSTNSDFCKNKSFVEEQYSKIENHDETSTDFNKRYEQVRSALIKAFQKLDKLGFASQKQLEKSYISLTKELLDPNNGPCVNNILLAMIEYLTKSKKIPLFHYSSTKDTSNLLPASELCIIRVLSNIENNRKNSLIGLLQTAMNSLYFIIPFKEQIQMCGLSALCRVFTKICKVLNCPINPLMLCSRLLKMKHIYAPYLVASITGVWKEAFRGITHIPDIEDLFLQYLHHGAKFPLILDKKKQLLTESQWESCLSLLNKTLPPVKVDVDKAYNILKENILKLLQKASFSEFDFMLSSPLVIYSAYQSWKWTKETILDNLVLPSLKCYSTEVPCEKAFKFLCNIYTDILMLWPDEDSGQSFLMNLFLHSDPDEEFSYVQFVTAYSLMKLCVLRKQALPKCLKDWLVKYEDDTVNNTHLHVSQLTYLKEVSFSIQETDLFSEEIIINISEAIQDL